MHLLEKRMLLVLQWKGHAECNQKALDKSVNNAPKTPP